MRQQMNFCAPQPGHDMRQSHTYFSSNARIRDNDCGMIGTSYRGPSGREMIVVMNTQAFGPGLREDAPLAQEKPSDLLELFFPPLSPSSSFSSSSSSS